MNKLINYLIMG